MIGLSFGIKLSPEEELIFKNTFWFIFKIYSLRVLMLWYFVGDGFLESTLQDQLQWFIERRKHFVWDMAIETLHNLR